jgi:hypothetical protein
MPERQPLTPDDERHGTRAGATAHYKEGGKPCPPCAQAAYQWEKKARLRRLREGDRMVELGEEAWTFLAKTKVSRRVMGDAVGKNACFVTKMIRRGPSARVWVTSRDGVLAAKARGTLVSPIGLQRRVRALSALGWSMKVVSEIAGVSEESLYKIRSKENLRFVREDIRPGVVAAYERLSMKIPVRSRSVWTTQSKALRRGYHPPMAWDNIDDPAERPRGVSKHSKEKHGLDEVAIRRRMAGDLTVKTHGEENREVVRRLLAEGKSTFWIQSHTGLQPSRYVHVTVEGAARAAQKGKAA